MVAGRGTGDRVKAEFTRTAQRHAHDAVFERQGGVVDRVVLDPQFADAEFFGEPVRLDERCEADLQTYGRVVGHRQQFAVTPHRLGTRLDGRLGQRFFDAIVIINHFERAEVELADVCGGERIFPPALAALERLHETSVFFHKNSFGRDGSLSRPFGRRGAASLPLCFKANKKPRLMNEKGLAKLVRSSHFSPTPVGAGIGTWRCPDLSGQPVAVASSGQSLSHSS